MALVNPLTTLADAKAIAGESGSTYDALFELLINSQSAAISRYCDRAFGRSTYTEYIPAARGRQFLILKNWPIQSVSSVKDNDDTLTVDVDYRLDAQDKAQGVIYREKGWAADYLVRGMTDDPAALKRTMTVAYTAGYYLPGSVGYTAGAADSLPLELSMVCNQMVAENYYATKRQIHGLTAISEGGLSYKFGADSVSFGNLAAGVADKYAVVLNSYKRMVIA